MKALNPSPRTRGTGTSPVSSLPHIYRVLRDDGIALLSFDHPDSSANIFDEETLDELDRHLDIVGADPSLKGVIFHSAKPSIFIAGADLKALRTARGDELLQLIEHGQSVFQKIADLEVPTIAAIHGACIGGGLEMALACDWRIASPDKVTKLGLPETKLGILPAWGGSTRLPRLIGLPRALRLILTGRLLNARKAMEAGVIDDVTPRERLLPRAEQLLAKGMPRRRLHLVTNNPLSASVIRAYIGAKQHKMTHGHYPALDSALEVSARSVNRPVHVSLNAEADAVTELATTEAAANLMRVFELTEKSKKTRYRSYIDGTRLPSIDRAAVIGAGVMGAGITHWLTSRGLPVTMRDISPTAVAKGMHSIEKLYHAGVARGILTEQESRRGRDLVFPSSDPVSLQRADIIIEAAVEDLELKKMIFRELCKRTRPDAILATNTSALPISEIAWDMETCHPGRIAGLHFFNPVHRMKLVEIVVAETTSPETVETLLRFTRRMGKIPVVVRDRPGFLVNRALMPYLLESGRLFQNGISPSEIDASMLEFGMPMGPLRLLDEIGLDVALHVAKTMASAFDDRFEIPGILTSLVERGLLGRKSGEGFYSYNKRGRALASDFTSAERLGHEPAKPLRREEIAQRLSLLLVNECYRVLDEGLCADADTIDLAMIHGTGFAPFRGGPLHWAEGLGRRRIADKLRKLTREEGRQFTPAPILRNE